MTWLVMSCLNDDHEKDRTVHSSSDFYEYANRHGWKITIDEETDQAIGENLKSLALQEYRELQKARKEGAARLIRNRAFHVLGQVELLDSQIQHGETDQTWHFTIGDLEFLACIRHDDSVDIYLAPIGFGPHAIDCLADLGRELAERENAEGPWTK